MFVLPFFFLSAHIYRLAGSLRTSCQACRCSTFVTSSSVQPPRLSFCVSAARCLAFFSPFFLSAHAQAHRLSFCASAARLSFIITKRYLFVIIYYLLFISLFSFCASAARCEVLAHFTSIVGLFCLYSRSLLPL
jgi:hypothetical protein